MRACLPILFALLSATISVAAEPLPAKGKLLRATELIRGSDFEKSVILLLHYDEEGAAGLIVNKPTTTRPSRAAPDLPGLADYDGFLFLGGPVSLHTMQALVRSPTPPDGGTHIVDEIYIVPISEDIAAAGDDVTSLRFFVGYAGWSPGQLDSEIERGSWQILPATADEVFDPDFEEVWRRLAPPEVLRASL